MPTYIVHVTLRHVLWWNIYMVTTLVALSRIIDLGDDCEEEVDLTLATWVMAL